jgi:hypothetical protein
MPLLVPCGRRIITDFPVPPMPPPSPCQIGKRTAQYIQDTAKVNRFCCTIALYRKAASMQKWDYLFVVVQENLPRYVNGEQLPDWKKGQSIFQFVKQLGVEGWELVSAPMVSFRFQDASLIFKRPAE